MKVIHSYNTFITFEETDASGRIYFANIFKVAHRCLEDFAFKNDLYDNWFSNIDWGTPARQCEAEFIKELRAGSKVRIDMSIANIGNSSFKTHFEIFNNDELAGKVDVTHVTVDNKTKKTRPVPEELLKVFK